MEKTGTHHRALAHGIGLLAVCLTGWLSCAAAWAADPAWTRDRTSTGLQSTNRAVVVVYQPGATDPPVPGDARITRVHASRAYDSPAQVLTDLCWGSERGPCVRLNGTQLNTGAFDGRLAAGPMLLVHRLVRWAGGTPPLFIRGTVTVWYATGRPPR